MTDAGAQVSTCAVRNCLECKERSRLGSWLRQNEESSLSPRASHLVSLIKGAHAHFKMNATDAVRGPSFFSFTSPFVFVCSIECEGSSSGLQIG